MPRKDKYHLQQKARSRRRCTDVSMSQETLTPLCQAAQVNLIRPIASSQCSNPPAHEAQTPPSIATMTATLCWVFSHWHRTWLSRDASPSSPERGLGSCFSTAPMTRHDGCLAFSLGREGRERLLLQTAAIEVDFSQSHDVRLRREGAWGIPGRLSIAAAWVCTMTKRWRCWYRCRYKRS
jgi:hypothetical protein